MSIAEKFEIIADAVYDKAVSDEREKLTKAITDNGARTNFTYAFAFVNWSGYRFTETITPTSAFNHMFYSSYEMTELPSPIDYSKIATATNTNYDAYTYRRSVFGYCRSLEIVPDLNMKAIGGLEEWFIQCYKLHTIELLRVHKDTIYNNTFSMCDDLQNINFDGEIGKSISFKDSPLLSVASMKNIITHLADYSDSDEADVNILTFHDNCWTALEASGKPSDDGISFSGTWREYVSALAWET